MSIEPRRRSGLRRLAGGVLAAALALGCWSASSGAQGRSATSEEVAALAADATTDDAALDELRSITEVDGVPVDLEAATADLGVGRVVRLELLADAFGSAGDPSRDQVADPRAAQREAEQVLDDEKFDEQRLPRPFKGLLEWLGDRLRPIGRALSPIGDRLGDLPGGSALVVALVGVALGAVGWAVATRRGRSAVAGPGGALLVDPELDPAALEVAADDAEAAGDLGSAVRLRYEAGLVRLVRAGRIELHPETTASDVARRLDDPAIVALTASFEAVVYGGREATAADVDAARARWPEVLGAVGGRR